MRHGHINNLKLFKITVFVVNNGFSGQLKQGNLFWKYLRILIYYLLSKFGVQITSCFKVMAFKVSFDVTSGFIYLLIYLFIYLFIYSFFIVDRFTIEHIYI